MSQHWDGYRIDVLSMDEALDVVDAFRPEANRLIDQENARLHAALATDLIDRAICRSQEPVAYPLHEASMEIEGRRQRIARERRRDPTVDMEFDLVLFRHRRGVHGQVMTERPEWRRTWLDHPSVHDQSWWDGSDRPDHVPAREWRRRQTLWQQLVPSGIPAQHGIVVHFSRNHLLLEPEAVLAAAPDMAARLRKAAVGLVADARMKQTTDDGGDLVAAASALAFWITSEEACAKIARMQDGLKLPDMDMDLLLGERPERKTNHRPEGRQEER